jgi:hypothetical protein
LTFYSYPILPLPYLFALPVPFSIIPDPRTLTSSYHYVPSDPFLTLLLLPPLSSTLLLSLPLPFFTFMLTLTLIPYLFSLRSTLTPFYLDVFFLRSLYIVSLPLTLTLFYSDFPLRPLAPLLPPSYLSYYSLSILVFLFRLPLPSYNYHLTRLSLRQLNLPYLLLSLLPPLTLTRPLYYCTPCTLLL